MKLVHLNLRNGEARRKFFEEAGIFATELPNTQAQMPQEDLLEPQDINDVSLEQTASKKNLAAQTSSEENLLNPNAPKEH